jgi:hypothetical protein
MTSSTGKLFALLLSHNRLTGWQDLELKGRPNFDAEKKRLQQRANMSVKARVLAADFKVSLFAAGRPTKCDDHRN